MTTILQKAAFLRRISLFCAIGALAISCGSYHNASYAQDGIYNRNSHVDPYASNDSGDFYQEYFASLSNEAEYLTDISSYVSPMNDSLLNNLSPTSVGYGSWGQQPSGVKINIYNNTRPYSYWGRPYWGYGYYSPFYDPYYFGSGFGYGFSYGWGGYYGSWYAGGYWGSPYYNNYWGSPYYRYNYYTPSYQNQRSSYANIRRDNSVNNNYYSRDNSRSSNLRNDYNRTESIRNSVTRDDINNYRRGISRDQMNSRVDYSTRVQAVESIKNANSNRTETIRQNTDRVNTAVRNSNYSRTNNTTIRQNNAVRNNYSNQNSSYNRQQPSSSSNNYNRQPSSTSNNYSRSPSNSVRSSSFSTGSNYSRSGGGNSGNTRR